MFVFMFPPYTHRSELYLLLLAIAGALALCIHQRHKQEITRSYNLPKNRNERNCLAPTCTSGGRSISITYDSKSFERRDELSNLMQISRNDFDFRPTPEIFSHISGLPGVIVQWDDIEVHMTNDELYRYVNHGLYPAEYKALRDMFGIHEMISTRYYNYEGVRV